MINECQGKVEMCISANWGLLGRHGDTFPGLRTPFLQDVPPKLGESILASPRNPFIVPQNPDLKQHTFMGIRPRKLPQIQNLSRILN